MVTSVLLALLVLGVLGFGVPATARRRTELGQWRRAGAPTAGARVLAPRPLVRPRAAAGSSGGSLHARPALSAGTVRLVEPEAPSRPAARRTAAGRHPRLQAALLVALVGTGLALAVTAVLGPLPLWLAGVPWVLVVADVAALRRGALRRGAARLASRAPAPVEDGVAAPRTEVVVVGEVVAQAAPEPVHEPVDEREPVDEPGLPEELAVPADRRSA